MPIDRSLVGHVYPPTASYEVSREAIRQFALAIDDPHPAYLDPEAARALGHPDVIAPPTFLITLTARFAHDSPLHDPAVGVELALVVHTEQRFTHHRPVVPGDLLSATTTITQIKDIATNEQVAYTTEVRDADGELVAELFSSILSRGTAAPKES